MPGKPNEESRDKVPGPGAYRNEKFMSLQNTKSSIVIGTGPRLAKDFSTQPLVPGPGTYKVKHPLAKNGGVIGSEPRDSEAPTTKKQVPGPGSY